MFTPPALAARLQNEASRKNVMRKTRWVSTLVGACFLALVGGHARAQRYIVVHKFSGGADGAKPLAGVTLDRSGNIFGVTEEGGVSNAGVIYRIDTSGKFFSLYKFACATGCEPQEDGRVPSGGVGAVGKSSAVATVESLA
jgi:uncharacterized repeat protein (TIGR03803 family)